MCIRDRMYADQQGFQDALTGAYLELKNSSAYGTELMYGTIEYLAPVSYTHLMARRNRKGQ